ncbi:hypothetical protein LTR37_014085 [Vermiconidia calcicola]|uniref:Uncharacterized protein n=1 Tax=Vermiconidia calcicola TaxID=1690605 RepID=A0ACC3MUI9_9PEZI|nr:hypothetical protein LTR37_014085 [Vermiconidia calcicola]
MAPPNHRVFGRFGYPLVDCGMAKLREILDDLEIDYDSGDRLYDLLTTVEKAYADQLVDAGQWSWAYLKDGFNPHTKKVSELRQILSYHGIDYVRAKANRSDLAVIWEDNIEQMRDTGEYEETASSSRPTADVEEITNALGNLKTSKNSSKSTAKNSSRNTFGGSTRPQPGGTRQRSDSDYDLRSRNPYRGQPSTRESRKRSLSSDDIDIMGRYIECETIDASQDLQAGNGKEALNKLRAMVTKLERKIE